MSDTIFPGMKLKTMTIEKWLSTCENSDTFTLKKNEMICTLQNHRTLETYVFNNANFLYPAIELDSTQ